MKTRISKEDMEELFENNRVRISEKIDAIIQESTREKKVLLAMDFDECVIKQHFSAMVTKHLWNRGIIEEIAEKNSVRKLTSLFHCYVGISRDEFDDLLEELFKKVEWKKDFIEAFTKTKGYEFILPVFISSGVTEIAKHALDSIGFGDTFVIADDLGYRDNKIYGPETIVSDQLKGDIVREFSEKKDFDKIVTVGHSRGDVELIKNGTEGYRVSFRDQKEAMEAADVVIDSWSELLELLQFNNQLE